MRVSLMGNEIILCALSSLKKGNQYMRYPNKKIIKVRFKIFQTTLCVGMVTHLLITKLMAFPTANKNDGKTKSVGVKPFQGECSKGENVVASFPDVFTIIIKQTVMPRNTSKATFRCCKEGVDKLVAIDKDLTKADRL